MNVLATLDPATRRALSDHVARLKHDLGKYVAFQIRWVPSDAPLDQRRAALEADLLATRRGPEGAVDASGVWSGMRPPLVGAEALPGGGTVDLSADADFLALDGAMLTVADVIAVLRGGGGDASDVDRGAEAALTAAEACRVLHQRLRQGA